MGKKRCHFMILFLICLMMFLWNCRPPREAELERRAPAPRREFDLIDRADEMYYSQKITSAVESDVELLRDESLHQYLTQLGERIINQSRYHAYTEGYEWSFKLFDSEFVNAFSLLGGKVYVSRSLAAATENESELAGVLAYEIAQVIARNLHQHLSKDALAKGEVKPGELIKGEKGLQSLYHIFKDKDDMVNYFTTLTFYPEEVEQADKIAFVSCHDAGFNPRGLADLSMRLGKTEKDEPASLWIKRNPWSERRESEAFNALSQIPPSTYPADTPQYLELKNQLQVLALPPLIVDEELSLPDYVVFHRVAVPGNVDWTDSGLNVVQNQEIYFQATGGISLQMGNPLAECGPEGYGRRTMQQPFLDKNIGALIGKVVFLISVEIDKETGEEKRNEITEQFFIGLERKVKMPINGRLYLGINENVVGDNDGQFIVKLHLSRSKGGR